jgi:hypothetical protein
MAQQTQPGVPSMMQDQQGPQPPQPPDAGGNSYYQHEHDLTGGLPISLDSLRDGPPGTKPFYPYSTLIRYAIKGSPTGKLLLEDIYYAIESRFPYFRTAPSGWKVSEENSNAMFDDAGQIYVTALFLFALSYLFWRVCCPFVLIYMIEKSICATALT